MGRFGASRPSSLAVTAGERMGCGLGAGRCGHEVHGVARRMARRCPATSSHAHFAGMPTRSACLPARRAVAPGDRFPTREVHWLALP
jgi:hypothetical protein